MDRPSGGCPDDELVQRASRGDEEALARLLDQSYPMLLAYVRLHAHPIVRARESCTDLVQSICGEAVRDLHGLEDRGPLAFRSWLCKRAMSKLVDRFRYWKAQKRDPAREGGLDGDTVRSVSGVYAQLASPSQVAMRREDVERLERAFDSLSVEARTVVTLARLVGLSTDEIAVQTGRSPGAVRVMLHRGLAQVGIFMRAEARRAGET